MNLFDLHGKTALVTGGAAGLGQGLAVGLAKAGADVAIVVNRQKGEETVALIEQLGRKAVAITADLGDEQSIPGIMEQLLAAFGKIDILVNNAGITRRAPAAEHSARDWHDVLAVNLHAVFFLSQLAGQEMIRQGSGKIINIASVLSFQGGLTVPGYAASKHAVAGLTKALSNDWAKFGINVNAIAPGYMKTDINVNLLADETRNRQISERIPQGRWGTPEDLQGPVVFLASEASNYLNGHVLVVDGGWLAR